MPKAVTKKNKQLLNALLEKKGKQNAESNTKSDSKKAGVFSVKS